MHQKIKNIIVIFIFFIMYNEISSATEYKKGYVKLENKNLVFEVDIADTITLREKGLMFRKKLDSNRGMLFIFPTEKNVEIWMKNTLLSLDIIFISKERLIVGLVKKALPLSSKIYSITKKSKYVLEVNGGIIDKYNINLGDKIKIEY